MTACSAEADGMRSSRPSSRSAATANLLGGVGLLDLAPQLLDLGLLVVGLAELLADGLELLAQEELALALLEVGLDVALDLGAQLEQLELAVAPAP